MKNKNKWILYAIIIVAVGVLTGVFLMNGQTLELTKSLTGFAAGADRKSGTTVNNSSGQGQSNYSCTVEVYSTTQEKLTKGGKVRTPDYTLKLYSRNNLLRLDLPYLGAEGTRIYTNANDKSIILYSNYTKSTYTDESLGAEAFIPPGADTGKDLGKESVTQGKEKVSCIVKGYQTSIGTSRVYFNEKTLLPVKAVFEGGKDNPPVEIVYTGYQTGKVSASTVTCPN
ncbi:MAG: hypothetical protein KBA53_11985 [Thermoclostridium sp.]|nr:hypothetical protein [Thermoclostridium sp.]